jgi:Lon protease-like protein
MFELPLFPLNVVLFPGMQLPLHVFESRYRLMMRRALDSNSTFGVALLVGGSEGEEDAVPTAIGCTAEIIEVTPFPDGRMNLLCEGRRRFRILETREQDGYLVGSCEWIADIDSSADSESASPEAAALEEALMPQARRVRESLRGYLMSLARNANLSPGDLDGLDVPSDPYGLSMWVAAIITIPNEQKQELLELTSTRARLDIESAFLRRGEIVQRAYRRRQNEAPPREDEDGPFSQFVSLN